MSIISLGCKALNYLYSYIVIHYKCHQKHLIIAVIKHQITVFLTRYLNINIVTISVISQNISTIRFLINNQQ